MTHNQGVAGSSPAGPTDNKKGTCAYAGAFFQMEFDCATNPHYCATDPTLVRTKWSLTEPTIKSEVQIFDC
jgi:hypothetical protein